MVKTVCWFRKHHLVQFSLYRFICPLIYIYSFMMRLISCAYRNNTTSIHSAEDGIGRISNTIETNCIRFKWTKHFSKLFQYFSEWEYGKATTNPISVESARNYFTLFSVRYSRFFSRLTPFYVRIKVNLSFQYNLQLQNQLFTWNFCTSCSRNTKFSHFKMTRSFYILLELVLNMTKQIKRSKSLSNSYVRRALRSS